MKLGFLLLLLWMAVVAACQGEQTVDGVPIERQERVARQREAREKMRQERPELFSEVNRILFSADPVGINFGSNTDEYEPEVGTILERLPSCDSQASVQRVVHEEFVHWFGERIAGPESRYADVAAQIWRVWRAHRQ